MSERVEVLANPKAPPKDYSGPRDIAAWQLTDALKTSKPTARLNTRHDQYLSL